MELRKILSKKPVKFLTLLLTAMLVATASAAVYYSLSMQPSVTITASVVAFKEGGDWSAVAGSMGTNNTWCSLALKAYPNATLTYEEPLNLTNTGANVQIRFRTVSMSPASGNDQVSNFTFINFTLYDEAGVYKGSLNYTTTSDDWSTPSMDFTTMDASDEWYIVIQTKAAAGAEAGIVANIEIAVDVQE